MDGCIVLFPWENIQLQGFFRGLHLGYVPGSSMPSAHSSQGYRTLAEAEKLYQDQAFVGEDLLRSSPGGKSDE